MNVEQLNQLSIENLRRLADHYDVDYSENTESYELAEMVLEAVDEARAERERNNNHAVSVQEKKYEIGRDNGFAPTEEITDSDGESFSIEQLYGETRLVLLLRDPAWAYAYWEISAADIQRLTAEPGFEGLFLRVYELQTGMASSREAVGSFEIPVQIDDASWYINLPNQGTYYRISLIAVVNGVVESLAQSDTVVVPLGARALEEGVDPTSDTVLSQSGLLTMQVDTYGVRIPQRILSLIDE